MMKILVAVDDEVFGEAIADFITQHRWPADTYFKVVHVIEPSLLDQSTDIAFMPLLESLAEESRKLARALIRHVALIIRDAFKTTHVEEEVLEGQPKEKILEAAGKWGANLIFVGSHGRRGISLLMLGSVSTAVVSHAACSVMVIRPQTTQASSGREAHVRAAAGIK